MDYESEDITPGLHDEYTSEEIESQKRSERLVDEVANKLNETTQ